MYGLRFSDRNRRELFHTGAVRRQRQTGDRQTREATYGIHTSQSTYGNTLATGVRFPGAPHSYIRLFRKWKQPGFQSPHNETHRLYQRYFSKKTGKYHVLYRTGKRSDGAWDVHLGMYDTLAAAEALTTGRLITPQDDKHKNIRP